MNQPIYEEDELESQFSVLDGGAEQNDDLIRSNEEQQEMCFQGSDNEIAQEDVDIDIQDEQSHTSSMVKEFMHPQAPL